MKKALNLQPPSLPNNILNTQIVSTIAFSAHFYSSEHEKTIWKKKQHNALNCRIIKIKIKTNMLKYFASKHPKVITCKCSYFEAPDTIFATKKQQKTHQKIVGKTHVTVKPFTAILPWSTTLYLRFYSPTPTPTPFGQLHITARAATFDPAVRLSSRWSGR